MANWANNEEPPITDTLPCGHHELWLRPLCTLPDLPLSTPIDTSYCIICELSALNNNLTKEISGAIAQIDHLRLMLRKLRESF